MPQAIKTKRPRAPILLKVPYFRQPDDVTCGPSCLVQVYGFHGRERTFDEVLAETPRNPDGGTLAVYLGLSALGAGFRPTIYSYNLRVFDPTWAALGREAMREKLLARAGAVEDERLRTATEAYARFLERGGRVRLGDLDKQLLIDLLVKRRPVLTGLSATYLYRTARERNDQPDDLLGEPVGHFVVVCGYYPRSDRFVVSDPARETPMSRSGKYSVPAERLIASILLGDATYDAVLLVL